MKVLLHHFFRNEIDLFNGSSSNLQWLDLYSTCLHGCEPHIDYLPDLHVGTDDVNDNVKNLESIPAAQDNELDLDPVALMSRQTYNYSDLQDRPLDRDYN